MVLSSLLCSCLHLILLIGPLAVGFGCDEILLSKCAIEERVPKPAFPPRLSKLVPRPLISRPLVLSSPRLSPLVSRLAKVTKVTRNRRKTYRSINDASVPAAWIPPIPTVTVTLPYPLHAAFIIDCLLPARAQASKDKHNSTLALSSESRHIRYSSTPHSVLHLLLPPGKLGRKTWDHPRDCCL